MSKFDNLVKDVVKVLRSTNNKTTTPYDTTATVTRIEGDTAWVHIAGGIDETPVKKTINAQAGDTVQVRVSGGRAWITGNASAPPTDDAAAIRARKAADTAQETAEGVTEIAKNAQRVADGVKEHFWHNQTGAHVTEVTQDEYTQDPTNAGGNVIITSQGIGIRDGETELASFTADGVQVGLSSDSNVTLGANKTTFRDKNGAIVGEIAQSGNYVQGYTLFNYQDITEYTHNFAYKSVVSSLSLHPINVEIIAHYGEYDEVLYFSGQLSSVGSITVNDTDGKGQTATIVLATESQPDDTVEVLLHIEVPSAYNEFSFLAMEGSNEVFLSVNATKVYFGYMNDDYIDDLGNFTFSAGKEACALGEGHVAIGEGAQTEVAARDIHRPEIYAAVGRYNEYGGRETSPDFDYALVIGAGANDNERLSSHIFTTDGNTKIYVDIDAATGSLDAELIDAIYARGWYDVLE